VLEATPPICSKRPRSDQVAARLGNVLSQPDLITDTANRLDKGRSELLAQMVDVNLDCVALDFFTPPVQGLFQLCARKDLVLSSLNHLRGGEAQEKGPATGGSSWASEKVPARASRGDWQERCTTTAGRTTLPTRCARR